MNALDAIKAGLEAFIANRTARLDYCALYPCTVVSQSGQLLELQPDSDKVPPISNVPLRLGLPGVEVTVAPGSRVLLGFEAADPRRPVATVWEASSLQSLTLGPQLSLLLGSGASDGVAMASRVEARLTALRDALLTWVPVPSDGGAALKAVLTAFFAGLALPEQAELEPGAPAPPLATWPAPVGSGLVKVKG
jgi:hypothetical protein